MILSYFKEVFEARIDDLEKNMIDNCEMGRSKESIERAFDFTRSQLGITKGE